MAKTTCRRTQSEGEEAEDPGRSARRGLPRSGGVPGAEDDEADAPVAGSDSGRPSTPTSRYPSLAAPTLGGAESRHRVSGVFADSRRRRSARTVSSRPSAALPARIPSHSSSAKTPAALEIVAHPSSSAEPRVRELERGGRKSCPAARVAAAPCPRPAARSSPLTGRSTRSRRHRLSVASTTDPSAVPMFHLVSAAAHSAKISIVGGSYSNGAPSVTLRENKPVMLMNTADRTQLQADPEAEGGSCGAADVIRPPVTLPRPRLTGYPSGPSHGSDTPSDRSRLPTLRRRRNSEGHGTAAPDGHTLSTGASRMRRGRTCVGVDAVRRVDASR